MQVARTSAGTYVSSRLAGPSEPEEEAPDVSLEMDELLCVTVDACGRASSGFMNVHFRYCSSAGGRAAQPAGADADEDPQHAVEEPGSADEGRRSEACPSSSMPQAGHDATAESAQRPDCSVSPDLQGAGVLAGIKHEV